MDKPTMYEEEEEDEMEDLIKALDDLHLPVPVPEFSHIQNLNVNLNTREVFVSDYISTEFGDWFTSVIRYLESKSDDPIIIWINTPGGDVQSMFTFHDLVRGSTCKVITIGTGQVCSAGVLMLACGNRRLVTESTVLMSHRGEDSITGNLEQMEAQITVAKWTEDHWAELMSRYSPEVGPDGKARDQRYWFQLGKKTTEWWRTGGEAIIAEGLADDIYHARKLLEKDSEEDSKEEEIPKSSTESPNLA